MNRKLKALGLALAAFFAMSVVAASAASAADEQDAFYTDGKVPAILTAHAEAPQVFTYAGAETEIKCSEVTIHEATITNESTSATVTPTYNKEEPTCDTPFGKARITSNKCHYTFTGLTTEARDFDAGVHISCPEKPIEIDAPLGCTIKVGPQTVYGVRYDNVDAEDNVIDPTIDTPDNITITTTVTGIHATANFACQLAGLPATSNEGTYTGNVIVEGFEDVGGKEGNPLGIYVHPDPKA